MAIDWWWDRPLHGNGYLGAWADPAFAADQVASRGELLDSTHNSFIEVLLGTGVVGLVLVLALFAGLWVAAGRRALEGRAVAAAWPLGLLVFVIVENLAETLWVGAQIAVVFTGVLIVVSTRSEVPGADGAPDLPCESDELASVRTDGGGPGPVGDDRVTDDGIAEIVRVDRND